MGGRRVWTLGATVAVVVAVALAFTGPASSHNQYEVWAIDQSDSPGKTYGGTLYIWDGHELEKRRGVRNHDEDHDPEGFDPLRWLRPATSERIDLGEEVSALCLARTGANPVRPHMIAVNPAQTHVIVRQRAVGRSDARSALRFAQWQSRLRVFARADSADGSACLYRHDPGDRRPQGAAGRPQRDLRVHRSRLEHRRPGPRARRRARFDRAPQDAPAGLILCSTATDSADNDVGLGSPAEKARSALSSTPPLSASFSVPSPPGANRCAAFGSGAGAPSARRLRRS
jgi:hypothetical protein